MRHGVWGVVFMMVLGVGVVGCSDPEPSSSPVPSAWPRPTGTSMALEPVAEIEDAERLEFDGVSVLVPDGWETQRTETAEYVMIRVQRPDDERNPVQVMVMKEPGTADTVESTAAVVFAQLAASGATDLEQLPATWPGWSYASGLTGVFDQGEGGVVIDLVQVTALSDSGLVVGMSAQAPRGKLESALSYQVMRSVRLVE